MNSFVTFYADVLIERYNFDNLDILRNNEIRLLWNEISIGLKLLEIQNFTATELDKLKNVKHCNLEKLAKLSKLVRDRNISNPSVMQYSPDSTDELKINRETTGSGLTRKRRRSGGKDAGPNSPDGEYTVESDSSSDDKTDNDFSKLKNEGRVKIKEKLNNSVTRFKRKQCNWRLCRNRTLLPCANSGCAKIACETSHSRLVCIKCVETCFNKLNITKEPRKVQPVVCHVPGCKTRTRIVCSLAICDKPVCKFHRYKLCVDCCFNNEFNYQI